MKGLKISEVFCEILSGLALMFCIIPILDILNIYSIDQIASWICSQLNGTIFWIALVLSYILGLIVDAIGLVTDDLLEKKLLPNVISPSEEERTYFWKNVSEHVLSYRNTQWSYYSAYRNLFILFIPGGIFWIWLMFKKSLWIYGIIVVVVFFILEIVFFKSMRALVEIYYDMTRSVAHQLEGEGDSQEGEGGSPKKRKGKSSGKISTESKLSQEPGSDDSPESKLSQEPGSDDSPESKLLQGPGSDDSPESKLSQGPGSDDSLKSKLSQEPGSND